MDEPSLLKRVVHAVCGLVIGALLLTLSVFPATAQGLLVCLIVGGVAGGVLAGVYLDRFWNRWGGG